MPFVNNIGKFIYPLRKFVHQYKGRLYQSDKAKDSVSKVIDGAYFINFMNVANQLYLYENYYLNNIPKEIRIEFLYEVTKANDILNNYGKKLVWIEEHSSYDHTLSIFDFEDTKSADGKLPTKEILDKPVSKKN